LCPRQRRLDGLTAFDFDFRKVGKSYSPATPVARLCWLGKEFNANESFIVEDLILRKLFFCEFRLLCVAMFATLIANDIPKQAERMD
jgi:hypothetical protein